MAAGASVRDSDFTMSVVTAVKQAAMMGSAITGVNSAKPGRRIMTTPSKPTAVAVQRRARTVSPRKRSEEHTSELQSLMRISYAVFCLKKKTTNIPLKDCNTHNNTQYQDNRKVRNI